MGCTINSLTLEISNEFLNITANVLAKNDIISNEIHDVNTNVTTKSTYCVHQVCRINGIDESK